ncbi:c-type cytochrome [Sulfuricystis multivorans]|uniref:c-type cytochrome n=1 Tax=Sulfuricystis multivorans TaxID=2211108 RepID=UPI000F81F7B5|nr:hypothetical protein [Sulfuricystis multivorans]
MADLRWARFWLGTSLLLVSLIGAAKAAVPNAVMLSIPCGGCHGTLGSSAGPSIPSLAGMPKDYFVASMQRFKRDGRATIMARLARAYSDIQIETMAEFFARLRPMPQNGPLDSALVKRGASVFYKLCRTCHLDKGALWRQIHQSREFDRECLRCHQDYGAEKTIPLPMIAGQWPEYLKLELQNFKRGVRGMSKRKAQKLEALAPEDIDAVAQFYASQKDVERWSQ